jgi:hypothetical protein
LDTSHFLFRLWVNSAFPLSHPCEYCNLPDITVKNSGYDSTFGRVNEFFFWVGPQKAIFAYRDVAVFEMNNGCEIAVSPTKTSNFDLIVNTILGTPMGIILLQRGFLVLHASAVEIRGKIVCFLGTSGAGKSTTVCSLIAAGHKLVTDDVVAIDTSFYPEVLPGYPWMKVGDELIDQLDLQKDRIESLGKAEDKRRYNIPASSFASEPSGKLAGIYFLIWADNLAITRMSSPESLINLVKHEYGFVPKAAYPIEEERRFLRSAEFVKLIPCFNLRRPKALDKLHQLAEAIEEHVQSL